MTVPRTEESSERYRDVDVWPSERALTAMLEAQREAVDSVAAAIPALAVCGEAVAERLRLGGRMVYAGAGSSGLMAQVDALELPGTYGIAAGRVPVLLAGGEAASRVIPGEAEDDGAAAVRDVDGLDVGARDALVAVSASGRTPYALAALRRAGARGALTVGMACNPDTPLLTEADHPILLATPPEVVAGSTRMSAGTAQKCALNLLSTLIGIRLGHVHEGMMVNFTVDNAKLRARAAGVVARAAGGTEEAAEAALAAAGGEVKVAILIAAGAGNAEAARSLLWRHDNYVRAALAALADNQKAEPSAPNA